MSTKHTPGPWNVKYSKFSIIETKEGAQVAECKNLTGLVNLQANARLISAAPELLEVLQKLLAIQEDGDVASWANEWDEARAAIAKATGEQP